MADSEANSWEAALLADLRGHDGQLTFGPLAGHPLLVMTSTGAKSGQPRTAILTYSRHGDDYMVAGTASGAPKDPAWVANVRAKPEVTVEVHNKVYPATATIVDETERAALWDRHVEQLPWFAEYPAQAGRPIPMIRLRLQDA
jgi:deazaflavin-dependent oxidoreductase (nitroreductase family)